jgi:hypothetical protein
MMNRRNIALIIGILGIPIVGITWLALQNTQDVRSKAAQEKVISIPTVVPAPHTLLDPPYIRLVSSPHTTYGAGDQLPVEIYAHTNGQPTVEARFVLTYDSSLLNLDTQGIQNSEVYPVINVESAVPGKTIFSVFVKEESGYTPVSLAKEQKIATLFFQVIGQGAKDTDITIVVNPAIDETTSISLFTVDRSNLPQNILKSSEGTTVTIK